MRGGWGGGGRVVVMCGSDADERAGVDGKGQVRNI